MKCVVVVAIVIVVAISRIIIAVATVPINEVIVVLRCLVERGTIPSSANNTKTHAKQQFAAPHVQSENTATAQVTAAAHRFAIANVAC